ncbi:MAG: sigma-70 family RNA polymerase sigma factor [Lentisphaeraceae bacterium]|nr:sigma-70 family RNA polymerase sigma factor [Lentisphaeraceae bacterium]
MDNIKDKLLSEVLHYKDRIWSYIFSIVRDYHLSEDVLQEVCLFLVNSSDKYDTSRSFLPWALGIARNKSYEAIRKNQRQGTLLEDNILKKLQETITNINREENIRLEALQKCLSQISEENRDIMTMKYVNRFSAEKIAKMINRSRTATFSLLQRVRTSLAGCVNKGIANE